MTALTPTQQRRVDIWWRMTPAQRDYDRHIARQTPYGLPAIERHRIETPEMAEALAQRAEDEAARESNEERGCSCHISAPCSFCVDADPDCPGCGNDTDSCVCDEPDTETADARVTR